MGEKEVFSGGAGALSCLLILCIPAILFDDLDDDLV